MEHLVILPDKPNVLKRRVEIRPRHSPNFVRLHNEGYVSWAGPIFDSHVDGDIARRPFKGSVMVVNEENWGGFMERVSSDIYIQEGIWDLEKAHFIRFRTVMCNDQQKLPDIIGELHFTRVSYVNDMTSQTTMVEVTVPHDASPQLYPTQKGHTGDTDLRTSESRKVSEKGPHETNPGQKLPPDYVRLTVTSQVYDVCKRTPLSVAAHLSGKLGYNVLLKRENEQPTFNCGLRGAYNMISQLDSTQICKGIITSGTDGHAEAVAHSARSLRIPAMIVMPESTSMEVQARFSAMKSVLVLHGADANDSRDHCSKLSEANGLIEIPTSENPHVIAGYGTIAWEILRQKDLSDTDALFCPLGDGGVVAGIGAFMKRMAPNVRIIGVQISTARRPIQKRTADGKSALPIRAVAVDHIGSLKKWTETNEAPSSSRSLIAIIGSASATFDQIQSVTERVAMRESSEALLSLSIPHMPHSLADLVSLLAPHVITELVYRSVSGRTADVLVGLSLDTEIVHGQAVVPLLLEKLASAAPTSVYMHSAFQEDRMHSASF
ncbi:hypothetical protein ACJA88_007331 [Fusarium oxysporum]